jgi:uncharacterized DUF497 family protein
MSGKFDWDDRKAESNLREHGVGFSEAQTVFFDPRAVTVFDEHHSGDEGRFITMGVSAHGNLLVVAYADDGVSIRIISARGANKREARRYAGTTE